MIITISLCISFLLDQNKYRGIIALIISFFKEL